MKPIPKSLKPKLNEAELKQAALGLLALREHSRQELKQKLLPRAESLEMLDVVLDGISDYGYQSDQRFTSVYLNSRMQRYGPVRLQQELKNKGIDAALRQEAMTELNVDWKARARDSLQKKYPQLDKQDLKQKAQAYRFLASRGFSAEQIAYALGEWHD